MSVCTTLTTGVALSKRKITDKYAGKAMDVVMLTYGAASNSPNSLYCEVLEHSFPIVHMYDWKNGNRPVGLGSCRVGNWQSSTTSTWNFNRSAYRATNIIHGHKN